MKLEDKVAELIQEPIQNLGYELYDVIYEKEAKDFYLRIFIDSEQGITIEDCEKVTNGINEILEEADYIKEPYFLEVSSTGIEKVLRKDKHLDMAMGEKIELNLFQPWEKKKQLQGVLTGYSTQDITMMYENDEITIPRKGIALMKTKYDWEKEEE